MTELTASPHFSGLDINLEHTMPEVLTHLAARHGERPALVGEDGTVTSYAGLAQRVRRLAAALVANDIGHGDRVAIWAPNSPEWIVATLAIETIGAIMVPINTRFKGLEAGYVLEKTRAKILFTVASFLGIDFAGMLVEASGGPGEGRPAKGLPALDRIVLLDPASLEEFEADQADPAVVQARMDAVKPTDTADILFTSGTTGKPKGAMHSHGQALWMPAVWNVSNDLREGDKAAIVNPFFHSFGYRSGFVSHLIAGMTVYPLSSFDPEGLLGLIEREKITVLMGPPTIFLSLMEHPRFREFNLSSLRSGHTGASKVPVELIEAGRTLFGFDLFLTSFGQTESTALVTVNYPDADFETIARTVGKPLPGVELKIIDAEGNAVPQGESGELLVRGPNVMQGYFEEPEQTAATIDPDGWLHTGDVGMIGDDGNLRILDRLKDVVIVGGFNAYPAEIENLLRTHPDVADVAIIAWPDERMGEVCAACIILRPGAAMDLKGLTAWCRERMANYKVPRHLFVVDEFPRTPLGKVQKFLLRDQVRAVAEA